MALNPRIMAIPHQSADREEHLHRFLTSLPNIEITDSPAHLGGMDGKEDGLKPAGGQDESAGVDDREHKGLEGVTPEKDLEVERRRYERKLRRRDRAAILNPKSESKPTTEKNLKVKAEPADPVPEEAVLSDTWWEEHRLRKRGLPHQPQPDHGPGPSRNKTNDVRVSRRIGTEVETRKKEKVSRGFPGLEMIRNYKPSVPITAPRLTMRPPSKGLFGNGVSSNPDLLRSITGRNNVQGESKRRITLRSSSEGDGDWRDQWRQPPRPPSQSPQPSSQPQAQAPASGSDRKDSFSHLPPPGNTQSTSWPSQLPSSDGPSLHPHPGRNLHIPPQSRIPSSSNHGGMYTANHLEISRQRPAQIGSESAVSRHLPIDRTDARPFFGDTTEGQVLMSDNRYDSWNQYQPHTHPYSPRNALEVNQSIGLQLEHRLQPHRTPRQSNYELQPARYPNEGYPYPGSFDTSAPNRHANAPLHHADTSFPRQGMLNVWNLEPIPDADAETSPYSIGNPNAIAPDLEPEMQDFWKPRRNTRYLSSVDFPTLRPVGPHLHLPRRGPEPDPGPAPEFHHGNGFEYQPDLDPQGYANVNVDVNDASIAGIAGIAAGLSTSIPASTDIHNLPPDYHTTGEQEPNLTSWDPSYVRYDSDQPTHTHTPTPVSLYIPIPDHFSRPHSRYPSPLHRPQTGLPPFEPRYSSRSNSILGHPHPHRQPQALLQQSTSPGAGAGAGDTVRREVDEYGTTTDDWKSLWSSRKPYH